MISCPYCGSSSLRFPMEDGDVVHWTDDDAGTITTEGIRCKKCGRIFGIRLGFLADLDSPGYITENREEIEEKEEEED